MVICLESIKNDRDKNKLLDHFADTAKRVIDISYAQMEQMAGNVIHLRNRKGEPVVVMSAQAFNSLTDLQLNQFFMNSKILYSDLTLIEKYGGGSARCMIAEVFHPE